MLQYSPANVVPADVCGSSVNLVKEVCVVDENTGTCGVSICQHDYKKREREWKLVYFSQSKPIPYFHTCTHDLHQLYKNSYSLKKPKYVQGDSQKLMLEISGPPYREKSQEIGVHSKLFWTDWWFYILEPCMAHPQCSPRRLFKYYHNC